MCTPLDSSASCTTKGCTIIPTPTKTLYEHVLTPHVMQLAFYFSDIRERVFLATTYLPNPHPHPVNIISPFSVGRVVQQILIRAHSFSLQGLATWTSTLRAEGSTTLCSVSAKPPSPTSTSLCWSDWLPWQRRGPPLWKRRAAMV